MQTIMAKEVTSADIEAKLKEMFYNNNKNFNAGTQGPSLVYDEDFRKKALTSSEIEKEFKNITPDRHFENMTGNRGQRQSKGKRNHQAQKVYDWEMSCQFDNTSSQRGFSVAGPVSSPDGKSHSRRIKQEFDMIKMTSGNGLNKKKEKRDVQQYNVCTTPVSPVSGPFTNTTDEKSQVSKMKKSHSAKYPAEKHKNDQDYSEVFVDGKLRAENYEGKKPVRKKKRKRMMKSGDKEGSSSENDTELKVDKHRTKSKPAVQGNESSKHHSLVSGCANMTEAPGDVLLLLEKERIFPLKKKSLKFPRANYFCRICDYHCDEIPDCEKHMKDIRHQRRKVAAEIETELKKIPAPCVRQVESLDKVIEEIYQEYGLNDKDLQQRKQLAIDLELLLQKDIPGIGLRLYGSSLTGFGLKDSDINIDLVVPKSRTAPETLITVFKVMKESDQYEQVQSDFSAKVPSVNFKEKKGDRICQITINSILAYLSNQLLAVYSGIDEKTRKLAVALRYWAKLCKVDRQAEGTIPSYCLAMMTVYYLQQCQPPVLPVITMETADDKKTENNAKKTWTFDYDKFKVIAEKWETTNANSVGQLWVNMLKFYSLSYEYANDVISIKELEVLKRAEKKWNNKRIAIEDPFSFKRNAARSVSSSRVFEYILDCFRRTYNYFGLPTGTQCVTNSLQDKTVGEGECRSTTKTISKSCQGLRHEDETENGKREKLSESVSDTAELGTDEDGMVDGMAERILSSIMNQLTVREENDSTSKENILESEVLIDKGKLEELSTVHSRHPPCACVKDDVCNLLEQLDIGEQDTSHIQSDIQLEHNSHPSDGMSVHDEPVSNTEALLSLASTLEVNSDHLFTNKSCLQDASDSPVHHSVLNSNEKEKLLTDNKEKDNAVLFTGSDQQSGSLSAGSDNSSKMVDKLSEYPDDRQPLLVEQTVNKDASSSGIVCHLCVDKCQCLGQVNNKTVKDTSLSDSPKSGVSAHLDLSCIDTRSSSSTESEEESDKESEDGKEVKSSEEYALKMLDAREMEDKRNRGEFHYVFSSKYFCDDDGPAVICSICDKEGHLKHACPEDKLPELQQLPPMTAMHLQFLTQTLKNVPRDFAPTNEDFQMRDRICRDLEKFIQDIFPDARLMLFGSSCNGFGFRQSDLDLCLTFRKERPNVNSVEMIEILTQKLKTHRGLYNVFPITSAKVPIVKFKHRQSQLEGDISLSNLLAQHNTGLLFTYSRIDPKVRILGYAIKVFAKVCDIGDASKGSLSSYAYILLLLHYLQNCSPPVIPVLQELFSGDKKPEIIVEGVNAWFYDDVQNLPYVWPHYGKNRQTIGELWFGLFRYYTEIFSQKDFVICTRQFEPLTRFEKLWNGSCLAIEDPFDLGHNLGGGLSRRMNNYILKAFINGRQIYGTPIDSVPKSFFSLEDYFFDAEQLTEGKPPTDRCCHVCNKIGHIAKECPVIVARKMREEKERQRKRENAGRERESEREQARVTHYSSPLRSLSVHSDRERVRSQVNVKTAVSSQSDPSGRASNPVPIQGVQRNYLGNQQIPVLLTRSPQSLPCSPPSPARPIHQLNSSISLRGTKPNSLHQVSYSARDMHAATAQNRNQQQSPAGQNLYFQMSPTLTNMQSTSPVSCGLLPTPSSRPLSQVASTNPVSIPILPLTFHRAGWIAPHSQLPTVLPNTAQYQSRDGPSTPPRHVYTAGGQGSPVMVAQNEFYRGSPPARSPRQWKQ